MPLKTVDKRAAKQLLLPQCDQVHDQRLLDENIILLRHRERVEVSGSQWSCRVDLRHKFGGRSNLVGSGVTLRINFDDVVGRVPSIVRAHVEHDVIVVLWMRSRRMHCN